MIFGSMPPVFQLSAINLPPRFRSVIVAMDQRGSDVTVASSVAP